MAKKEQELTASMIDTFREFKETKNIDRTTSVSYTHLSAEDNRQWLYIRCRFRLGTLLRHGES